jgi:hypothetical protein
MFRHLPTLKKVGQKAGRNGALQLFPQTNHRGKKAHFLPFPAVLLDFVDGKSRQFA